jgi:hypothetical protein
MCRRHDSCRRLRMSTHLLMQRPSCLLTPLPPASSFACSVLEAFARCVCRRVTVAVVRVEVRGRTVMVLLITVKRCGCGVCKQSDCGISCACRLRYDSCAVATCVSSQDFAKILRHVTLIYKYMLLSYTHTSYSDMQIHPKS